MIKGYITQVNSDLEHGTVCFHTDYIYVTRAQKDLGTFIVFSFSLYVCVNRQGRIYSHAVYLNAFTG